MKFSAKNNKSWTKKISVKVLKFTVLYCLLVGATMADVVKPVLVEISIYPDKRVEVVIDLSLEASISGIGTQYKKTTDAPNSNKYDELRKLKPAALRQKFANFEAQFLRKLQLTINQQVQTLQLKKTFIDIVGYTKRPRKSVLTYVAQPKQLAKTLTWKYDKAAGDSAMRYQIFKKDEYNWSQWQWLRGGKSSGNIDINHPKNMGALQRFGQFVQIGFEHVIPLGWDHILFIIGMALSTLLWRKLLLLVSSFTLAHTLTLGLAMFEVVQISAKIIEPLIAFSIAYVAIENLNIKQSMRRKIIVVFLFGLIHGLGFANMLKSLALKNEGFITTLIGFNVGVELAQITIVAGIVAILLTARSWKLDYQKWLIIPSSILIALLGIWWGIERIIA